MTTYADSRLNDIWQILCSNIFHSKFPCTVGFVVLRVHKPNLNLAKWKHVIQEIWPLKLCRFTFDSTGKNLTHKQLYIWDKKPSSFNWGQGLFNSSPSLVEWTPTEIRALWDLQQFCRVCNMDHFCQAFGWDNWSPFPPGLLLSHNRLMCIDPEK